MHTHRAPTTDTNIVNGILILSLSLSLSDSGSHRYLRGRGWHTISMRPPLQFQLDKRKRLEVSHRSCRSLSGGRATRGERVHKRAANTHTESQSIDPSIDIK